MSLIGENIYDNGTPRYVRHPAATGGWLVDGKPIDAATAQILDSNASWLSHESLRHWVTDAGPGTVTYQGRGYSGLTDVPEPSSAFDTTDARTIAWDRRTAIRCGPFDAICDAPLSGRPGYGPRPVALKVDANAGAGGSLVLLAALTSAAGGPVPPRSGYLAFDTKTCSAGRAVYDMTLQVEDAPSASRRTYTPCRNTGARGTTEALVMWVYLWIGWHSTNGSDAVVGFSAWETRT